jgi:Zn-dependent M16 (insulinase) family peptidase
MDAQMKKDPSVVVNKLKELVQKVFVKQRLLISFTADMESYKEAKPVLCGFIDTLMSGEEATGSISFLPQQKNEGFTDASAIQYVARSGNYVKHGYSYNGAIRLMRIILSYDYLWNNVRVLGGAYGCSSSFGRTGESYFVSYRDPNLSKTNAVYEGIPKYLRDFQAEERDMTKYIIGTFGALDAPVNPEGKGNRSMTAYLQKITLEDIQKERDEILNATVEDIRGLAPLVEAVLSDGNFCVVGNEQNIHNEKDMFFNIRKLNE